jgi:cobaltochelatase CobS subunit
MRNLKFIHDTLSKPFAERRKLMRNAASGELKLYEGKIKDAITRSQFDIKPSYAALRDSMSMQTLIGIVAGVVSVYDVCDALIDPENRGIESHGTKHGYDIGRPDHFNDASFAALIEDATKLEDTPDMNLSELIAIIDHVTFHTKAPLTIIKETMRIHTDVKLGKLEAALDAIRIRDETPTEPPYLSAEHASSARGIAKRILDTPEEDEPTPTPEVKAKRPDAGEAKMIDAMLSAASLPSINTMLDQIDKLTRDLADASAAAKAAVMPSVPTDIEFTPDGKMPTGKVTTAKAYEAFGLTSSGAKSTLNFDVPVWQWDAPHPHVPVRDPNYIFRPFELFRVLYAVITNQRCYLHGHTGTGKTTLVEQVAAVLNWPVMRVNFDSEITRMDLIGRDVLSSEDGATTSTFVDGILPQMMSGPYIGIFDEIDFVRPDVAYVMQRAFEGNGLMLTEDGGRIVSPHKMFRMFATGNTVGQGDEHGMYQGARPQSMALLDRFTVWVKVDYMSAKDREKLIAANAPTLGGDLLKRVNQYIGEHLEAFTTAKVLQPISPRTFLAFAKATEMFTQMGMSDATNQALEATVLDRASVQDRAVLNGLAKRVFS